MRLIDADKLMPMIPTEEYNARMAIVNAPTVDAEPIKHGHWITLQEALEKEDISLASACSVCGHCDWDSVESEYFNYCPNCGAKMDSPCSNCQEFDCYGCGAKMDGEREEDAKTD